MKKNTLIDSVTSMTEIKNKIIKYIKPTDSCMIHTSLSAFGYIPGGERAIIKLLKELLNKGNIVMPAQTNDLSDPAEWMDPPASNDAQIKIKKEILPFNMKESPIHMIGRTPEYFRTSLDVRRSNHPLYSVCAWGKNASEICKTRTYDMPFSMKGPLGKLYELNAKIIMLGTDYESCTALHLSDSTINRPVIYENAPVMSPTGETEWVKFKNVELDKYDDFNEFGQYFEKNYPKYVVKIKIYHGYIRIISMRKLVDIAQKYYFVKDKK